MKGNQEKREGEGARGRARGEEGTRGRYGEFHVARPLRTTTIERRRACLMAHSAPNPTGT